MLIGLLCAMIVQLPDLVVLGRKVRLDEKLGGYTTSPYTTDKGRAPHFMVGLECITWCPVLSTLVSALYLSTVASSLHYSTGKDIQGLGCFINVFG